MLIQEANQAALNDKPPEGKGRRWIAREAWSMTGKQLKSGPGLLATADPGSGFVYYGQFATVPNFPLSGADVMADDWYIIRFDFLSRRQQSQFL